LADEILLPQKKLRGQMFFPALAALSRAAHFDVTSENQQTAVSGDRPIFLKYYSPSCGHCRAMAEDFAEAAAAFTDVDFGNVDCSIETDLCDAHHVHSYPTLQLYLANSTTPIEYDGTRTADAFCDFVENYTNVRPKRPPKVYADVNPLNFDRRLSENKCLLVTFYARWCQHSKRWLPHSRTVATSLIPERNISLSIVNCESYDEFCDRFEIKSFPAIRLFTRGETIPFNGARTPQSVLEFINDNCGTEREVGGLLNDSAGLVPDAAPIVQEFLANEEGRAAAIAKMKEVPGAEFYVKVMERFVSGGLAQIRVDMGKMASILGQRNAGWQGLDSMKRRYNIFAQFDPGAATPTPPPAESPVGEL
jgi:protein disulfide-isomerase A6